jgi:hypothetical protein
LLENKLTERISHDLAELGADMLRENGRSAGNGGGNGASS